METLLYIAIITILTICLIIALIKCNEWKELAVYRKERLESIYQENYMWEEIRYSILHSLHECGRVARTAHDNYGLISPNTILHIAEKCEDNMEKIRKKYTNQGMISHD